MKNEESQTQRAFIKWCRLNEKKYPELQLAFSVPNGGHRNVITASILKAEGVRAGIPDWCLPVPRMQYAGLWIEFKSSKGRLSEAQEKYIDLLKANRHAVCVCNDWEDARDIVLNYLSEEVML